VARFFGFGSGFFLLPKPFGPDGRGRLVVAGMAPAGGHDDIKQLIDQTGRTIYVFSQRDKLPEIYVQEAPRVHFPGDPIHRRYIFPFGPIGPENPVPDIEEVAKIGIHVQGIF